VFQCFSAHSLCAIGLLITGFAILINPKAVPPESLVTELLTRFATIAQSRNKVRAAAHDNPSKSGASPRFKSRISLRPSSCLKTDDKTFLRNLHKVCNVSEGAASRVNFGA